MLSRSAVKAVLFDLDGTLIDTMGGFADLAAEMMVTRHGLEWARARARYLETSGIPFCDQLEIICPGHSANLAASHEFEARKLAVSNATTMEAGTIAGLEALRALGMRLVVSSNTPQAVVEHFAAREAFRFDLVLGLDRTKGLGKGRAHVELVLVTFGATREELLFVGDSLNDADLADECGVAFVGRVGTFREEDFRRRDAAAICIRDLGELPALLAP